MCAHITAPAHIHPMSTLDLLDIPRSEFIELVAKSKYESDLLRLCGFSLDIQLNRNGRLALRRKIDFIGLDTSHWKTPSALVQIVPDDTFRALYHESSTLKQLVCNCDYHCNSTSISKIKQRMEKLNLVNKFRVIRPGFHPNKLSSIDDDSYRILVNNSTNESDLARKCGYKKIRNKKHMSILIDRAIALNIDMSHWKELTRTRDIFAKIGIRATNKTLKRRLIKELKWPYECRKCKNKAFETRDGELMWMDEPIELTLEHKNGDNKDNRLENLEFLCMYCHQQTKTFGGKNTKKARLSRAWIEE